MITIIMCRGIGETRHDNLLWNHLRPLLAVHPGRSIRFVDLPWPAQYGPVGGGPGHSYSVNLGVGMDMLRDEVDFAERYFTIGGPNEVFLVGYSAGATLVGNYGGGDGLRRVRGIGLVADPMRPRGTGAAGYVAPGWGVGGERALDSNHVEHGWWISDPRDIITSCPDRSPLGTIADQSWAMSFAPGEFPAWIGDLVDRVKKRRWQPSAIDWRDPLGTVKRYAQAVDGATGYLFRGEHTSYASRVYPGAVMSGTTYIETLAGLINKEIAQ